MPSTSLRFESHAELERHVANAVRAGAKVTARDAAGVPRTLVDEEWSFDLQLKASTPAPAPARAAIPPPGQPAREEPPAPELEHAPSAPEPPTIAQGAPLYEVRAGRIVWLKRVRAGEGFEIQPVELAGFEAEIVGELLRDDGVEQRRDFEVRARIAKRESLCTVPAADFAGMAWVPTQLGAQAIIAAGPSARDHLRAAIQTLSRKIASRTVFAHTGWRDLVTGPAYLHANGAIGAAGAISGVEVELPAALAAYALPPPPESDALKAAIRASLRFLNLAPLRVTQPMLAAIFRATIADCDFSLWTHGPTGVGKTALVAVLLAHHGAGIDARQMPGSWTSTDNSLEALASAAKDALLVVDDYAPGVSAEAVAKLRAKAERILRAQGNRSGRGRMRADGSLRPDRPPRGMILSTGEDLPTGQSVLARSLCIRLERGDVDWARLTDSQRDAAAGLLAQTLSGYLRWVARQRGAVLAQLKADAGRLRDLATRAEGHKRTPAMVADLMAAWRMALEFAADAGAVDAAEREQLEAKGWAALLEQADAQAAEQRESEPAGRFLALLASALGRGTAHLASPAGGPAIPTPEAWGWREFDAGRGPEWRSSGSRVGWFENESAFLDPSAAFAAADELARATGAPLGITPSTLWRRLDEQGHLASRDVARGRLTIRRVLDGARREVLHLRPACLGAATEGQWDGPRDEWDTDGTVKDTTVPHATA